MREIKFRAWFTLTNEMVKHEHLSMSYDIEEGFTFAFNYEFHYADEDVKGTLNFELMQYTGLKDKNGVEIYEGDVLKVPDLYETPENTETTYHNELIIFQDYAFCLGEGNPLYNDHQYVSDQCEVIGNIHKHPHLLEESK